MKSVSSLRFQTFHYERFASRYMETRDNTGDYKHSSVPYLGQHAFYEASILFIIFIFILF